MLLKSLLQSVEFILSKMENGVGYCKPIMKRDLGTWDFKIKKNCGILLNLPCLFVFNPTCYL